MKGKGSTHCKRQPEAVDVQHCRRRARRSKEKAPTGSVEGEARQAFTHRKRRLIHFDSERTGRGALFEGWIRSRNGVAKGQWEQGTQERNEGEKLHDVQAKT